MRSQGEEHRYNPQTIHLLQESTWTGSYDLFKQYTALADKESHGALRGLLEFNYPEKAIPIEEVESVDEIVTTIQDRCNVLWIYFSGST